MLVPNEILVYWFKVMLMGFLNEDWDLVMNFLIDMKKIVDKVYELNAKQMLLKEKQKRRNPNKFERNKYTRVIKK